jgi:phage/plasmid-associated DNA primase
MDFIIEQGYCIVPLQSNSKITTLKGWPTFDKEQGNLLVKKGDNYGVRLGKIGKLIVIDVDEPEKKNEQFFIKQARAESRMSTRTPHGHHLYFLYDERFDGMTRFRIAYVDILVNNTYAVGPGSRVNGIEYILERDGNPERMSDELFQEIMRLRSSLVTSMTPFEEKDEMSKKINKIVDLDCMWNIVQLDNGAYKLTPKTRTCLVKRNELHSREEHSCLIAHKTAVVAQCFSHNKLFMSGSISSQLRSLFFNTNPVERILNGIIARAYKEKLVRKDNCVWKRNENISCLYEKLESIEEFTNDIVKDNEELIKRPKLFKEILFFLETIDNTKFPIVKASKRYLGFRNGLFDLKEEKFIFYNQLNTDVFPRHYIGQDYDEDAMNTPLFDNLIKYQLSSDTYSYLLAFMGRMFYEVGEKDEWQIAPLIKGDSGTGKSTVLGVISSMFSSDRIGSIGSNLERTFGLQSNYDKDILLIHELSSEMSSRLGSDLFKKMICGEEVSIPIKNKTAEMINWSAPIFMCGNAHLSYEDTQGSISRRIAIFKFDNYVEKKDSFLKSKIVREELASLIAKCFHEYRQLREKMGDKSFWECCPEYFHDNTDEAKQETDYLYRFLTMDPEDNKWGFKRLYFRNKQGSTMLLEDFKKKYHNYMKYRHPEVKYKWTSDYSSFKRLGYNVKCANTCKACMKTGGKGCCSEYNRANRSVRYIIENIKCIEE